MSSETKRVEINVRRAERLLGEAITALDREDHKLAMLYVKEAEKARRQALRRFTVALKALKKAKETVEEAERRGEVNLTEAKEHLLRANNAFELGDYTTVEKEAKLAMGKCFAEPILGKDVVIKTELEPDESGYILYRVKVGNTSDRAINEIPVTLKNLQPYLVCIDDEVGVIRDLKPGDVKEHVFRLELVEDYAEVGDYYLGRDLTLSSSLDFKNGKLVSLITVTNRSTSTIVDLSIQPFVPQGYRPDKVSKEIDVLYPNESKSVMFYLLSEREEAEKEVEIPVEEPETEKKEAPLEDKDAEFPDTEYDEELKELEHWTPAWKEELPEEIQEIEETEAEFEESETAEEKKGLEEEQEEEEEDKVVLDE